MSRWDTTNHWRWPGFQQSTFIAMANYQLEINYDLWDRGNFDKAQFDWKIEDLQRDFEKEYPSCFQALTETDPEKTIELLTVAATTCFRMLQNKRTSLEDPNPWDIKIHPFTWRIYEAAKKCYLELYKL